MSKNRDQRTLNKQPRIGMTMRFNEKGDFYLRKEYSEALAAAGGIGLHLPLIAKKEFIKETLAGLDGLLLPGSDSDVDPLRYNEEPHQKLGSVQPLRDETDCLLLTVAEEMRLPILGICYGMQALNVARGGTLIQDLKTQVKNSLAHQQRGARDRRSHHIYFETNCLLAELAGDSQTIVNSYHHQSVKTIGQNLKIVARSSDGVIEAVEDTRSDRFVVGVQWHPELNWQNDKFSQNLFEAFIKAAGEFKSSLEIDFLSVDNKQDKVLIN